ncbi:protein-export chaperone SecB [Candidatus Nitrosacidococcus tergens]|uniref:Protein-export protein SecB n=1 Tax=Candidatus Nitrosacidococcus tergens TaxID=553981 RepID=A0A7G1Q6Y5_9GAMM|nr:protein-export chaperone SecB [Candidatus Nitrosacidococcus tergens]CAB1274127.1 protein export chaperone [Candidatus Nitrosacidococcus tergens]
MATNGTYQKEDNEQQNQQSQFSIQKIYVKDLSFEAPNSPHIFTKEWKPEINIQLSSKNEQIAEHIYEVVLSVTVAAKINDQTAFLTEAQQAGIFNLVGYTKENLGPLLGSYCPAILFPFIREVVTDLVTKGGFPPLLLAPVNFDAFYAQQLQQQKSSVDTVKN